MYSSKRGPKGPKGPSEVPNNPLPPGQSNALQRGVKGKKKRFKVPSKMNKQKGY